jgi:hypothetical protein
LQKNTKTFKTKLLASNEKKKKRKHNTTQPSQCFRRTKEERIVSSGNNNFNEDLLRANPVTVTSSGIRRESDCAPAQGGRK